MGSSKEMQDPAPKANGIGSDNFTILQPSNLMTRNKVHYITLLYYIYYAIYNIFIYLYIYIVIYKTVTLFYGKIFT